MTFAMTWPWPEDIIWINRFKGGLRHVESSQNLPSSDNRHFRHKIMDINWFLDYMAWKPCKYVVPCISKVANLWCTSIATTNKDPVVVGCGLINLAAWRQPMVCQLPTLNCLVTAIVRSQSALSDGGRQPRSGSFLLRPNLRLRFMSDCWIKIDFYFWKSYNSCWWYWWTYKEFYRETALSVCRLLRHKIPNNPW